MAAPLTIYHNAECSKSNGALEILSERGIPFTARFYLQEPLSIDEMKALLHKLDLPASAIVRRGEPLAQELTASGEPDEETWIQILADNPSLLERPIVEAADRAVVARPPERVLKLL